MVCGLEIHAQLNTERKLFSGIQEPPIPTCFSSLAELTFDGEWGEWTRIDAKTSFNEPPNTHVAVFDAALPGSQPVCEGGTGTVQRSHGG